MSLFSSLFTWDNKSPALIPSAYLPRLSELLLLLLYSKSALLRTIIAQIPFFAAQTQKLMKEQSG